MSLEAKKRPVRIRIDQAGTHTSVEIDGNDISKYLSGVTVESFAGELVTVTLDVVGAYVAAEIDGELVVQIKEEAA